MVKENGGVAARVAKSRKQKENTPARYAGYRAPNAATVAPPQTPICPPGPPFRHFSFMILLPTLTPPLARSEALNLAFLCDDYVLCTRVAGCGNKHTCAQQTRYCVRSITHC